MFAGGVAGDCAAGTEDQSHVWFIVQDQDNTNTINGSKITFDVDLKALVVHESRVDMGPLLGFRPRWRPRAMGRATPIRKRTSHLIVGLVEDVSRSKRRDRTRATAEAAADAGATE